MLLNHLKWFGGVRFSLNGLLCELFISGIACVVLMVGGRERSGCGCGTFLGHVPALQSVRYITVAWHNTFRRISICVLSSLDLESLCGAFGVLRLKQVR